MTELQGWILLVILVVILLAAVQHYKSFQFASQKILERFELQDELIARHEVYLAHLSISVKKCEPEVSSLAIKEHELKIDAHKRCLWASYDSQIRINNELEKRLSEISEYDMQDE